MRPAHILALLLAALLTAACGPAAPQIAVSEPWARAAVMTGMRAEGAMPAADAATAMPAADATAMPAADATTAMPAAEGAAPMAEGATMPMADAGGNSAVYMRIVNSGGAADRLVAASTDAAAAVELHESRMVGDVMQMAPVEGGIPVPANGEVELKPGGLHVMLIGLTRDLQPGDTVTLTLTFEGAGAVTVEAPVRQP